MSEIISGPAAPDPRRIRRLSIEDAAACAALVETVGWHADEARWRMFLSVGVGFGVEREDGALAGVVMVHPFGAGLASIAMMMVEPSQQRRGLGALLMRAALAHATPATIFLYASEAGEPLYANLGFVIRGNTTRFEGRVELPPPAPHDDDGPIENTSGGVYSESRRFVSEPLKIPMPARPERRSPLQRSRPSPGCMHVTSVPAKTARIPELTCRGVGTVVPVAPRICPALLDPQQ